ncbi:MAG: hypothetical protein LC117_09395 [Bacteroidia bacterium]|nr:hypothetical protein [Bacteroidia bacterium]MCZ2278127.1 hypothetical protein [Bacteroidia bacterium]
MINRFRFFRLDGIPGWQMTGFFLVKITAGFALAWIYSHWYTDRSTADTFKYFDDSYYLYELFFKNKEMFFQFLLGTTHYSEAYLTYSDQLQTWWNQYTLYNDARTMVRLNAAIRFISGGYYAVHSVIFCFITFTGLTALCKALMGSLKHKKLFVWLLFLFPSLTFWSSGVMKDGIIFIGTGFLLYLITRHLRNEIHGILFGLGMLLFMGVTFFSKLHIFLVLIPCLVALLPSIQHPVRAGFYFTALASAYLAILIILRLISPATDLITFMAEKQHENIRVALELKAGSYFHIPELDGSILNFLINIPVGLFNAIVQPLPIKTHSPLVLISALENTFILLVILILVFKLISKRTNVFNYWFWFSLLFVVILFSVIGMMTPVAGALVRYKIQGLPFLFYIITSLLDGISSQTNKTTA